MRCRFAQQHEIHTDGTLLLSIREKAVSTNALKKPAYFGSGLLHAIEMRNQPIQTHVTQLPWPDTKPSAEWER
jgi:hypothetical protein